MNLALETLLHDRSKQGGDDEQVRQVSEGKGRHISAGQKGEAAKREGRTKPTGTPTLGLLPVPTCVACRRTHGRSESLVAGHSATLDAVVVIVPPMQSAVVGTRTIFRVAILLCSMHMLHGKNMLRVADVQPGLEAVDRGQIFRLTIRVKESGWCLGLIDASSQMSCRSHIGPAAPLTLWLTLYFLALVRVRRWGFGSNGPT